MTYDHWKSTNPADEWLGPEPNTEEERPISLIQRFGRDWALRAARRLAFDAGVDDASRITALQKLLRDL